MYDLVSLSTPKAHSPVTSSSVTNPTNSAKFKSYGSALPPFSAPADFLESNINNLNSSAVAPLKSSIAVSSLVMLLESSRTKPIATATSSPVPTNTTHQKGQSGMNGGRWTDQEHQSFLTGLRLYGREWKKVAAKIKTRTSAQIRSHAQKYFAKLSRDDKMCKYSGLSTAMFGPVEYFSDGGSSVAQNSSDDDGCLDGPPQNVRSRFAIQNAAATIAPCRSKASELYNQPKEFAKKRLRTQSEDQLKVGLATAKKTIKLQKRAHGVSLARVEHLPSQEDLLAKASPNLRHRLSNLIDAELCALQVLLSHAMLQHQYSAPGQKSTRHGKKTIPATSTFVSVSVPPFRFSVLSTEQIPSKSSIY